MFVGKEGAYPIEEPFRCSTLGYSPGLAGKACHDKHSSLLQKFVTYGCKNSYNIGPWRAFSQKQNLIVIKLLNTLIKSQDVCCDGLVNIIKLLEGILRNLS